LLLGNKGDSIVVRKGCNETEVIGLLAIPPENAEARDWLKSCEIPLENSNELTVRRILKDSGKSSCYLQHVPIAQNKLREFMALIFDLHSQHQNQSLYHSRAQLRMLDYYAGLGSRASQFSKTFQDLNQKRKELEEAQEAFRQQREMAAYLQKAIEEIEELRPEENEDVRLSEQIELLSNSEGIHGELDQLIGDSRQAIDFLNRSQSRLESLAPKLGSISELVPRLQSAGIEIEDILDSIKQEKNALHLDPAQLQEFDRRLSQLIRLSRKYGNSSLRETIRFGKEAADKLAALESSEDRISEQKQELQAEERKLMEEARYLSQQRKKYAKQLQESIEKNLQNLGMGQAQFQIELSHRSNDEGHVLCHSQGIDKVRFLLAANSGEDFHEIRHVASGGEISRIMLAIKSEPAQGESSSIETIIFDEIDSGIGGETGIRLAQHIHSLARRKQILCVTHLASIAASADTHIKIEKLSDSEGATVNIFPLEPRKRPAELARMLSGDAENPTSLAHAEELLSRYS
ncbi:MAG: hypothetical protein AAF975_07740, partial [Spirochaetota bacterium]